MAFRATGSPEAELRESIRSIAVRLGRSPSTVSREVSRNGGSDSYRASEADERTWERARRPKSCRLARSPRLRQLVEEKLRQVWSPEQIAGWLKHSYPEDESLHVLTWFEAVPNVVETFDGEPYTVWSIAITASFPASGCSAPIWKATSPVGTCGGLERYWIRGVADPKPDWSWINGSRPVEMDPAKTAVLLNKASSCA